MLTQRQYGLHHMLYCYLNCTVTTCKSCLSKRRFSGVALVKTPPTIFASYT